MKCKYDNTELEITDSERVEWDNDQLTMYLHLFCPKCQRTSGRWEYYKLIEWRDDNED